MRALQFLLKALLITIAAAGAFYYAIQPVHVGGIHSVKWTAADLIRDRCHFRLIQPEWVSSQPDMVMNWVVAESKARGGLVAAFWLASLSTIIWRFVRVRKNA